MKKLAGAVNYRYLLSLLLSILFAFLIGAGILAVSGFHPLEAYGAMLSGAFVDELSRMGAEIRVAGRVAVVNGVRTLHGAAVKCTDLRGGAALVIAGLSAEGTTRVTELTHIDRGYDAIERDLAALGAQIRRETT